MQRKNTKKAIENNNSQAMNLKLIILLSFGALVLGALIWQIVRAWRYRRDHPDEILWPYSGDLNDKKKKN